MGTGRGSLKADNAGVWWSSMSFEERIQYLAFIENQGTIEKDWHPIFGDRKNEIVFIGQDLEVEKITAELESCLYSDKDLVSLNLSSGFSDSWPVERTQAV